ncbi:MAG: methyltransferase domain-containing protein [Spirochaetales bacterium]|nr:methyltransferase domain-containing protein [Spirochaetales bacterium]
MDFRKIFDTVPDQFDRWRPRYCEELFRDLIGYSGLDSGKSALEIGPGTGQATEPVLKTGCLYLAIELGEHLAEYTRNKFKSYINFHLVNADFETHDFGRQKFDLVYSAATIQWIPEKIAFPKVFQLLNGGGTLAMMLTQGDYKTPNESLHSKIQNVYSKYFHPEQRYTCELDYSNVLNYGFIDFECRQYYKTREFNADEYIGYIGTHSDHITLKEPFKSKFYEGIKKVILEAGNKIIFKDTIILYLARKP